MAKATVFGLRNTGAYLCNWRASEARETLFTHVYGISRYIPVRVEYVIVKARQRGNYAANSPSPRALARGRGLSQHNFRGNPLL